MTDDEVIRALELDDSFKVVRVLVEHRVGATELVADAAGQLYVRKRIPLELANRDAWERLMGVHDAHVPQVACVYQLPDVLVVVCRYVMGTTVAQMLDRQFRLTPYEAAAVAGGVCDALAILHDRGVIHRDVSPGNVVVRPDVLGDSMRTRTCLIDLGVARVTNEAATHDTKPLGTPGFSAPEQYGFAQTDARSDLYAVGRLLLCLAVGHVCDQAAIDLAEFDEHELPGPLRDIVAKACAFEPSARYQSALQMGEALAAAERTLGGADGGRREPALPGTVGTTEQPRQAPRPEQPRQAPRPQGASSTTHTPPVPGSGRRRSDDRPAGSQPAEPEQEIGNTWPDRLKALFAQPRSALRTFTIAFLGVSLAWLLLLGYAIVQSWIVPKTDQMFIGAFGGVALFVGHVWFAWELLCFATEKRPVRSLVLRLLVVLVATLGGILTLGILGTAIVRLR